MSKLDDLLGGSGQPQENRPEGLDWYAAVFCQHCHEPVYEQQLYPSEYLLVWTCSKGHRSYIEGYSAF